MGNVIIITLAYIPGALSFASLVASSLRSFGKFHIRTLILFITVVPGETAGAIGRTGSEVRGTADGTAQRYSGIDQEIAPAEVNGNSGRR